MYVYKFMSVYIYVYIYTHTNIFFVSARQGISQGKRFVLLHSLLPATYISLEAAFCLLPFHAMLKAYQICIIAARTYYICIYDVKIYLPLHAMLKTLKYAST